MAAPVAGTAMVAGSGGPDGLGLGRDGVLGAVDAHLDGVDQAVQRVGYTVDVAGVEAGRGVLRLVGGDRNGWANGSGHSGHSQMWKCAGPLAPWVTLLGYGGRGNRAPWVASRPLPPDTVAPNCWCCP